MERCLPTRQKDLSSIPPESILKKKIHTWWCAFVIPVLKLQGIQHLWPPQASALTCTYPHAGTHPYTYVAKIPSQGLDVSGVNPFSQGLNDKSRHNPRKFTLGNQRVYWASLESIGRGHLQRSGCSYPNWHLEVLTQKHRGRSPQRTHTLVPGLALHLEVMGAVGFSAEGLLPYRTPLFEVQTANTLGMTFSRGTQLNFS